jgi:hypothetical protein
LISHKVSFNKCRIFKLLQLFFALPSQVEQVNNIYPYAGFVQFINRLLPLPRQCKRTGFLYMGQIEIDNEQTQQYSPEMGEVYQHFIQ